MKIVNLMFLDVNSDTVIRCLSPYPWNTFFKGHISISTYDTLEGLHEVQGTFFRYIKMFNEQKEIETQKALVYRHNDSRIVSMEELDFSSTKKTFLNFLKMLSGIDYVNTTFVEKVERLSIKVPYLDTTLNIDKFPDIPPLLTIYHPDTDLRGFQELSSLLGLRDKKCMDCNIEKVYAYYGIDYAKKYRV